MIFISDRKPPLLIGVSAVLIAMAVLSACELKKSDRPTSGESGSSWTYPLRLGDSRGKAHEILGNATRTTEVLEEYPLSGVTLWFSPEGRATKFNFQGSSGLLYSGGQNWIPSDRTIVFGLTSRSTDADFLGRLGNPVSENEAGSPGAAGAREVRRIWRKGGYLIDALFLASDRSYVGQTLPKGSLVWVEISPGL